MHFYFKLMVIALFAAKLSFVGSIASAAEPACELFKTIAPVLDVLKNPPKDGAFVAELKKNDVVCIKQKRKIGKRTWGHVAHQILANGTKKSIAGWVGLRFMAPHKATTATTATPAVIIFPSKTTSTAKKSSSDHAAEIAYWNTVRTSNDADLILLYLDRYPKGTFAKLARLLIDKIDKKDSVDDADRAGKTKKTDRSKTSTKIRAEPSPKRRRATRTQTKRRTSRKTERRKTRKKSRRRIRSRDYDDRGDRKRTRTTKRRRSRAKRCRQETQWECTKRGGTFEFSQCQTNRICK
jgi:hypothetical protein